MKYLNKSVRVSVRIFAICMTIATMLVVSSDAYALRGSRSLPIDHRIHTIAYQEDEVFKYIGHYGYQALIEFAQGETIQTISMGDSTAWMLNPAGRRLFLKPVSQDATTNMTLITNKRTYLFELHGRETDDIDDPEMVFITRFVYPDSGGGSFAASYLDTVPEPYDDDTGKYNMSYTISGSDDIAPLRIFDDGEFTYFQFADKNAEIPAFYWVDSYGNESIINYRTRGNYIVVERVSSKFTLRHGEDIICVFNEKKLAQRKTLRK